MTVTLYSMAASGFDDLEGDEDYNETRYLLASRTPSQAEQSGEKRVFVSPYTRRDGKIVKGFSYVKQGWLPSLLVVSLDSVRGRGRPAVRW